MRMRCVCSQLVSFHSARWLTTVTFLHQIGLITLTLRSLEWAFAKKPLQRYGPLPNGPNATVERRLSIPNVLLDAFDLVFNHRGIGWSWSPKPSPRASDPYSSIAGVLARLLVKLVVCDTAHYLMQYIRPSLNVPTGDTFFDPTLSPIPRYALAAFFGACGAVVVYTVFDAYYHFATLIGRVLLRQPDWAWPPLSDRPWMSTSIVEFWSFRWHQFLRQVFVVYGARPGGALLGKPGACIGAFVVSGVLHDFGIWGLGRGIESCTTGGFFFLMGVGVALEYGFKRLTGRRVGGFWGWVWTMLWTLCWGTLMIDGWARRGIVANDFFPDRYRPGKRLVDAVITLSWR
jgi:Membrane bound O-acyl transferase family